MMDYEVLRFIWWLLIGVLLIGFVITDGFDLGVAVLLKLIGKNDDQRRVMINSIAPHWDGNQVWLVTAIGALFAAWPTVYAAAFSSFYFVMMLTLFALFLRPIGFEYRAKIDNDAWRNKCDWALTIGSAVPAVLFGVAFGNLLQGVPFYFDDILRLHYTGGFFDLLNPFALFVGLFSFLMLVNHGATYLQLKTEDDIKARSERISTLLSASCAVLFVLAGLWLYYGIDGYSVTSIIDTNGINRTTEKTVVISAAAWFNNYAKWPWLSLIPILGVLSFMVCALSSATKRHLLAFLSSAVALTMVIATAGVSMFPFIMPSSSMPAHSLTMWDATASQTSLQIMFVVACVFVPIVLSYTAWSYFVMRGRLNEQHVRDNSHSLY
ncbi:cytochrome d ubiquinol oxidase subunit II [Rheinheimera salexigens]|uniref:Cytochrome d ubiquinol oxidase subunit II n=1 Tax=Rheinheimera salexigens TaxID=1628148 RepID=A0A1E7Q4G5_9GAMM|nr:cytochrome d ubiquinol oxidase subunit II [Rheinheimera salexigens]